MKKKKTKRIKKRDGNIQKAYQKEINLQTKSIPDKRYKRYKKYKGSIDE